MICKFNKWSIRDAYRLPMALILWPMVSYNYWQRKHRLKPDEWYWADAMMWHYGYAVVAFRTAIMQTFTNRLWPLQFRIRMAWFRLKLRIRGIIN